ncbi:hypothetical protein [Nocardioides sp.]|uniref:hypothetical protein n=1 Tax=Nocardioides sp. TaxID=35761 RepID=UPI0039E3207F
MTSRVVLPGVVLGVVVLALFAAIGIGLPKAVGDSDGHGSSEPIVLPDTLPGGYTATDLEEAWASAPADQAEQASAYARNEAVARTYADKVLAETGVVAATRSYISEDLSSPVIVQAFRADGGAFSPLQIIDASTAEAGDSVDSLVTSHGVTCIQAGTADGAGGVQASYFECQKSADGFTIQVTSASTTIEDAVDLVESVWAEIA